MTRGSRKLDVAAAAQAAALHGAALDMTDWAALLLEEEGEDDGEAVDDDPARLQVSDRIAKKRAAAK